MVLSCNHSWFRKTNNLKMFTGSYYYDLFRKCYICARESKTVEATTVARSILLLGFITNMHGFATLIYWMCLNNCFMMFFFQYHTCARESTCFEATIVLALPLWGGNFETLWSTINFNIYFCEFYILFCVSVFRTPVWGPPERCTSCAKHFITCCLLKICFRNTNALWWFEQFVVIFILVLRVTFVFLIFWSGEYGGSCAFALLIYKLL